jgi:ABC-type sugar transport system permease subunit
MDASSMRSVLPRTGRAFAAGISWTALLCTVLMILATVAVVLLSMWAVVPALHGVGSEVAGRLADLQDETFRTLVYALLTAAVQVVLAIGVAMYCLARWPIRPVYLLLMLTPYFIPSAFVHGTFSLLFLPDGLFTEIFRLLGIESPQWATPFGRFVRLVVASIWQFWPFAFLLALARLLAVPLQESRSVALAARNPTETLGVIALRNLLAVVLAVLVARFLFMSAKFELPFLMSEEQADVNHNLLTVEMFRGFRVLPTPDDPTRPARAAAPAAAILISISLLTLLFAGLARATRVLSRGAAESVGWWFDRLNLAMRILRPLSLVLLAAFVLVPMLALVFAAFTPDTALADGWNPGDITQGFTLAHFRGSYEEFAEARDTSWYHAFLRTLLLSSVVSALAAAMGGIAGAMLSMRAAWMNTLARVFSVLAFGVPTTLWIFALAWINPAAANWLPPGMCPDDTGKPSLIRGAHCQIAVLWGMHLVVASSIALYLSLAFWRRAIIHEGFRQLRLYGIDASRPGQLLRALWLVRRRQLLGVFCAVFPIVFAVSWSDIGFSRYLAPDGQKLFVDAVAAGISASSADGTRFGQMAVAALLALAIATLMGMVVKRGLR